MVWVVPGKTTALPRGAPSGALSRMVPRYPLAAAWDGANHRLVRVEHSRFGPAGGEGGLDFFTEGGLPAVPYLLIATFEYDALGRRIRATYYNRWGNIVDDTLYYYDGQRVVAEYDYDETAGTQTLARWFVDGPLYVDEHVMMHDATTGDDYFHLPQELYSVAGLVDEDGELVEAHAYDAYGDVRIFDLTGPTPTELDVSAVGNPYYFTGRRRDPIHNPLALPVSYRPLYHYRARAYDPLHGRFLQRDPAEYVDGMNLYEYGGSSPIAYVDPEGLWKWKDGKRQGKARAIVLSETGDTIDTAARFTRLDPSESLRWLKDETMGKWVGKGQTIVSPNCPYSVPNTVVVAVGDVNAIAYQFLLKWGTRVSDAFEQRGFSMSYFDENVSATGSVGILKQVTNADTWGFAVFGHGKDEKGLVGGFVVTSTWTGAPTDMIMSTGARRPGHKYGGIISYHCYADKGRWGALVSVYGSWRHAKGIISAAAGPRALSPAHWGSWDSLVDEMVKPKK